MTAFVHGYKYDIFVSYAHVDNLTADPETSGWVELFHKHLEVQLYRRFGRIGMIKIWRDEKLDGSQLFNDTIKNRINQSAVLLSLTSPGYLQSEYCQKELQWFRQKTTDEIVGLQVEEHVRILNVLLYNIVPGQWPKELQGRAGFHFHDADNNEDFGEPLAPETWEFRQRFKELVKALYNLLNIFANISKEKFISDTMSPSQEPDAIYDVYFAEVADTLRLTRQKVTSTLEQKKITVHKMIPPPHEKNTHREAVTSAMKNTKLSVHLLDGLKGAEISGEQSTTYLQKQLKLGFEHARHQLIWVPKDLNNEAIEDEQHKIFLEELEYGKRNEGNYVFIRGMKNEIPREIKEKLELLQIRTKPAEVPLAVLLDTHMKDQLHALEMSRFLLQNNIQPYINPEDDHPQQNIQVLRSRLRQVEALIIFFGQVREDWVRARLEEAVKIVISEDCPVKVICIYLAPPNRNKDMAQFHLPLVEVHILDNRQGFDPKSLSPLFQSLGTGVSK